ncbi:MAG: hypothetical protein ACRC14_02655 [Paracoccaceae bacterium]
MNGFQVAYLLAMLILTSLAWRRQRYALGWLWLNLIAMLAAAGAMDMGWLDRSTATLTMMLVDFGTGVGLAMRPGLPRLIAWGYAVTIPIYAMNVAFGVPLGATWGMIYLIAVAQLGVLAGGSLGNGGSGRRRRASGGLSMALPGRDKGIPKGAISGYSDADRVQN